MPQDDIDEIKRRLDIVDFISGYVPLKKAGANFKALCPFHNEKTPSFMVSTEKQIWHCFGCQKGGDIFAFLQEMEGLEFVDALKVLADKAGVQLRQVSPQIKKQKSTLFDINTIAAKFYHHILTKLPAGKNALQYLKNRGLKDTTISEFIIGYAPDKWELIYQFLVIKKHLTAQDVVSAGLIIPSQKKSPAQLGFYDRFRDRIIFPIWNLADEIVGFSGRTLKQDTDVAKYINSPDSPVYSKSRIIYGLDKARAEIKKQKLVVIVEGQMDLISLHQAGFKNTVATSGTALTSEQIETLKKFTENMAFAFDEDAAGDLAAKRAIEIAAQAGINIKMIITPLGKDPDECVRQDPKIWQKAVGGALPVLDFYFQKAFAGKTKITSDDKRAIARELLPIISHFSDSITQGEYIQKLSQKINVPERYLWEALKKIKPKSPLSKTKDQKIHRPEKEILSERILEITLLKPEFASLVFKDLKISDFTPQFLEIVKALESQYNKNRVISPKILRNSLSENSRKQFDLILLKAETEFNQISEQDLKTELQFDIQLLVKLRLNHQKLDFEQKIRTAEQSGDKEKLKKIISEFQNFIIQKG